MKTAYLILAAYQATAAPSHPYIDKTTREAIEKQESAVCGQPSGYYGLIDAPIYVEAPKRPKVCKTKLPEATNE